jgi:serine/threonine protein kinase
MLHCLKQMHKAGYLHRDVKPDNFMISLIDHKVRIRDMSLAMEYMNDGKHKGLYRYGFLGTPHYGSMQGLTGYTLSRRDDLEALGYSIMFLIDKDQVPWINTDNK